MLFILTQEAASRAFDLLKKWESLASFKPSQGLSIYIKSVQSYTSWPFSEIAML